MSWHCHRPRTHHHDDDAAEAGPAVFSDINITPSPTSSWCCSSSSCDLDCAGRGRPGGAGAGVRVDLPKGAAKELQTAARDFTVAILKSRQHG